MVEPALPGFAQVQDPLGVLLFPPRKIGAKKTGLLVSLEGEDMCLKSS